MSAIRTLAPSLAKRMHVSRPMPLARVSSATCDTAKRISKIDDDNVAEMTGRQVSRVIMTYKGFTAFT
jgi:hypothetical protein